MAPDPRTPVVVGVGQVSVPPDAGHTYAQRPTPLELMRDALVAAAEDTGRRDALLARLDEVVAVSSFVWHPRDPAGLVLESLGLSPRATALAPTGGSQPQRLVAAAARRVGAGEIDAMAIVGAEAMYAHRLARREGRPLDWPGHEDGADPLAGGRDPFTPEEQRHGLGLPVGVYPLFENARRARRGWSIDEHRARLGELWAGFARVAATNPHAWRRDAPDATTIATPSAHNRMVGFPYTKLLVANLPVDMGAAVVVTSFGCARELGVATEKMVFPQCAAQADDHWFVSDRPDLDRSPAMEALWGALRDFGVEASVDLVDLYSCFPTVVQTAAEVIGLDPFDPRRPPTVTGGLTFAGGPGNNYVTHAIAAMVERLRARPDATGLVTGLGWFSTEHAWGTYAATPPAEGFRWRDAQGDVASTPRVEVTTADGPVVVETYTVTHGADGAVERLVVCGRRDDGRRRWAHSEDPELAAAAEAHDLLGTRLVVRDGRVSP